jgi:hypothetical protein
MKQVDEAAAAHVAIWELIPWVLNGRASAAQRGAVAEHLENCGDCRQEVQRQRQLQSALLQQADEGDTQASAEAALARLWTRIDAQAAAPAALHAPRSSGRPWLRLMLAVIAIESLALTMLAGALWQRSPAAAYRTLTSVEPPRSAAIIRAVFTPAMRLDELRDLLQKSQLQIVAGPGDAGIYTLAPLAAGGSDPQALLLQLRADPRVRLAEPLGAMQ